MTRRFVALLLLSAFAALLIAVTIWSAVSQYKTYEDPRDDLERLRTTWGIGVGDSWARVYEPDVQIRVFRKDSIFFADVDLTLNAGVNSTESGSTDCYYFVPPGAQMANREDVDKDGVRHSSDTGDLRIDRKLEDYWVYRQTCRAPEPTTKETETTSTIHVARFTVPQSNVYRSGYSSYEMELDVGGLDGASGLVHSSDEELFSSTGVMPSVATLIVDASGWDLSPHVPAGLEVTRETATTIEVRGGGVLTADDQATIGGVPTFTFSKPSGALLPGVVQLFATLVLGIVLDQIIHVARSGLNPAPVVRPVPPAQRSRPKANRSKRRR